MGSSVTFLVGIIVLILRRATAFAPLPQSSKQRTIQEYQQQHKRYIYPLPSPSSCRHRRRGVQAHNKKDDEDTDEPTLLDEFLDKPFFDPDAYDDSDKSLLGRLAAFVRQDYELAETMYVGILFVVLVIVSQELLRMKLYGDQYIPFSSGPTNGRLF